MGDEPRSYYQAYKRRNGAESRGPDALFVDRGCLRAQLASSGKAPLPLERKIIDRDDYTRFLEDQLERTCAAVVRLENEVEVNMQAQIDELKQRAEIHEHHTTQIVGAVEVSSRGGAELHERAVRADARIEDLEARLVLLEKPVDGRLTTIEEEARAFCSRVGDLERAVSETLYALDSNDDGKDMRKVPLEDCVRLLRAEVSRSKNAAQRAEARVEELSEATLNAERASREIAEAANRHAEERAACVVEAIAEVERRATVKVATLEAQQADFLARQDLSRTEHAALLADLEEKHTASITLMESRIASIQDALTPAIEEEFMGEAASEAAGVVCEAGAEFDAARKSAQTAADDAMRCAAVAEADATKLRSRAMQLAQRIDVEKRPDIPPLQLAGVREQGHDGHDARDARDARDVSRDARDVSRDARDVSRDGRDARDVSREGRDARDVSRDARDEAPEIVELRRSADVVRRSAEVMASQEGLSLLAEAIGAIARGGAPPAYGDNESALTEETDRPTEEARISEAPPAAYEAPAAAGRVLDGVERQLNRLEALDDAELDSLEDSLAVLRRRRLPSKPARGRPLPSSAALSHQWDDDSSRRSRRRRDDEEDLLEIDDDDDDDRISYAERRPSRAPSKKQKAPPRDHARPVQRPLRRRPKKEALAVTTTKGSRRRTGVPEYVDRSKWPRSVMHCGPNATWVPAIKVSTPRVLVSRACGGDSVSGAGR